MNGLLYRKNFINWRPSIFPLLTCEPYRDVAGGRVARLVPRRVAHQRVPEGEAAEGARLRDCERRAGVVVEQRLVPVDVHLLRVRDEVGRRLAEVNHRSLCVCIVKILFICMHTYIACQDVVKKDFQTRTTTYYNFGTYHTF